MLLSTMIASALNLDADQALGLAPWVRLAKIQKSTRLSGTWTDYDHEFTYVHSGQLELALEGERFVLEPGGCVLMPPLTTHYKQARPGEPLVQYIVHFDWLSIEQRCSMTQPGIESDEPWQTVPADLSCLVAPVVWQNVLHDEQKDIEACMVGLMDEFAANRQARVLSLRSRLLELVVLLERLGKGALDNSGGFGKRPTRRSTGRGKSWASFERTLGWIRKHWRDPTLDNGRIAKAVELSPNYLSEVFRTHTGLGLHEWLVLYRLDKAKGLLEQGNMAVGEVAEYCGFSGIHGFSRIFSEKVGMGPGRYKTLHKPGVMWNE